MGAGGGAGGAGCAGSLACPLGQVVGLSRNSCYFADVSKIGQDAAGFPAFCLLSRFALGALLAKYAFIRILRRFVARFRAFVWVCIACVLCVACGAFVCVNS